MSLGVAQTRQISLQPFTSKIASQPRILNTHRLSVSCHAHCRHTVCAAQTDKTVEENKAIEEKPEEHKGEELENPDSEMSRKKDEADRLRAAEKFMKIGTGEAICKGCGYEYRPSKGDPEYPISAGTYFRDLPQDWLCPICGAAKNKFENRAKELAGFEENMGYGFGTNTMTSGQKSLLIYGSLLAFFALFCAGYLLT